MLKRLRQSIRELLCSHDFAECYDVQKDNFAVDNTRTRILVRECIKCGYVETYVVTTMLFDFKGDDNVNL